MQLAALTRLLAFGFHNINNDKDDGLETCWLYWHAPHT